MALFKSGPTIAAITGTLGGVNFVASSKRPVVRVARRRPSQDADSLLGPRANLKTISVAWTALSAASRAAWSTVAATLRRTDRLGQSRQPTGREYFFSHNMKLAQCGLALNLTNVPLPYNASTLGNIDFSFPGGGDVLFSCDQSGAPTTFGVAIYGQLFYRNMAQYLAVASQTGPLPPPNNYRFITHLAYLPPNAVSIQPAFGLALGAFAPGQTLVLVGRYVQSGFYSAWENWVIGNAP